MLNKLPAFLVALVFIAHASISFSAPIEQLDDDLNVDGPGAEDSTEVDEAPNEEESPQLGPRSTAAIEAFLQGNIDECLSHMRSDVAKNPDSPPPKLMLAGLFLKAGQHENCRQLLEEVAAADANHPELFLTFANLALLEGRLTEALHHFEKMEQLGPRRTWDEQEQLLFQSALVGGRAQVAERRKNWDQAQTLLAEWLKIEPGNARLRDRRATALFHVGRKQQAFGEFDIAYQQSPEALVPPQVAMAVLHVQQGEYDQANEWFAKARKLHPSDARVPFQWAMASMYQDQADEAATHAEQAARLGMDSVNLDIQRGIIARQQMQHSQAVDYFSEALERSPDHQAAQYHLALTYLADGKPAKALELAESHSKEHPNSPWAAAALGWAQYAHGQPGKAEESLRRAISLGSHYPEILYLYGRVLSAQGKEVEARQAAKLLATVIDAPEVFVTRQQAREWLAESSEKESGE